MSEEQGKRMLPDNAETLLKSRVPVWEVRPGDVFKINEEGDFSFEKEEEVSVAQAGTDLPDAPETQKESAAGTSHMVTLVDPDSGKNYNIFEPGEEKSVFDTSADKRAHVRTTVSRAWNFTWHAACVIAFALALALIFSVASTAATNNTGVGDALDLVISSIFGKI